MVSSELPTPTIEIVGVGKSFGPTRALDDVSVEIVAGTVHALVGENGAGKSTLGKIIGGLISPDAGVLRVAGVPRRFRAPRQALQAGIALISQELALVPQRTVAENVFLHTQRTLSRRRLLAAYEALDSEAGFGIVPTATVRSLRLADQQKVEILRALARNARVIVMDEPTAVLSADEAESLHRIVRDLHSAGRTVVYVSHFLEEVLTVSDTITILRDGKLVRTGPAAVETTQTLISGMVGRPLAKLMPAKPAVAEGAPVRLEVRNLSRGTAFEDVSFTVRVGEILGIAGVVGSGRTEVARCLVGADRPTGGTVSLDGASSRPTSPRAAQRRGMVMVPESRKTQGLILGQDVQSNVVLPRLGELGRAGFARRTVLRDAARSGLEVAGAPTERLGARIEQFSGGNQQKVLFAKWLGTRPRVLVADEPTQGVDVAAKESIYRLLFELVTGGMSIVLISSDLDELLGLAHRVIVLRRGRVVAELAGVQMSRDNVMHAALASTSADRRSRA